jgi:hypothetical protein
MSANDNGEKLFRPGETVKFFSGEVPGSAVVLPNDDSEAKSNANCGLKTLLTLSGLDIL